MPQATVIITPRFQYNIRGLFMSFSDVETGSNWSILFDVTENMNTFLRHIMAAIAHVLTYISNHASGDGAATASTYKRVVKGTFLPSILLPVSIMLPCLESIHCYLSSIVS